MSDLTMMRSTNSAAFRTLRVVLKLFMAVHALIVFVFPYMGLFRTEFHDNAETYALCAAVSACLLIVSAYVRNARYASVGAVIYSVQLLYVGWTHDTFLKCLYSAFAALFIVAAGAFWVIAGSERDL